MSNIIKYKINYQTGGAVPITAQAAAEKAAATAATATAATAATAATPVATPAPGSAILEAKATNDRKEKEEKLKTLYEKLKNTESNKNEEIKKIREEISNLQAALGPKFTPGTIIPALGYPSLLMSPFVPRIINMEIKSNFLPRIIPMALSYGNVTTSMNNLEPIVSYNLSSEERRVVPTVIGYKARK